MTRRRTRGRRSTGQAATPAEVGGLQARLLTSVLTGAPLPGGEHRLQFPDLAFLLRASPVLVLDRNLAYPKGLAEVPLAVRIVSSSELAVAARERDTPTFVEFQAPESGADVVSLTLHARVFAPDQGTLGLTSVRVVFRRADGDWMATSPELSAS